jgi:hypothetical protein
MGNGFKRSVFELAIRFIGFIKKVRLTFVDKITMLFGVETAFFVYLSKNKRIVKKPFIKTIRFN